MAAGVGRRRLIVARLLLSAMAANTATSRAFLSVRTVGSAAVTTWRHRLASAASDWMDTNCSCDAPLGISMGYPSNVWTGNSMGDGVLKFSLKRMKLGVQDAFGVLDRVYAAIDRVTGCIVAHNADHDLR